MPIDPSPSPGLSSTSPVLGLSGGYTGDSLALRIAISVFISLAIYNSLELTGVVLSTFTKCTGLYFWSLLASTWGIVLYSIGFLCKFFQLISNDVVSVTMITVGWWGMVTGQSLVLYSLLHLIVREGKTLRRVLAMIMLNVVLLHVPTTVLTYGSNAMGNKHIATFVRGYNIMEKIQLTGFSIQETIISGLYLYETARFLRAGSAPPTAREPIPALDMWCDGQHKATEERQRVRSIMRGLFTINVIIILMDIGLLALESKDQYILQIVIKGWVYGLKLKLEFAILGRLIGLVSENSRVGRGIHAAKMSGGNESFAEMGTLSESSKTCSTVRIEAFPHAEQNDGYPARLNGRDAGDTIKGTEDLEMMMRKYSVPERPAGAYG